MGYKAPLSKHERDLRLGYAALGVGAAAFVLMVATTLQVTDTDVPGLPVAGPPETSSQRAERGGGQEVVPAQVLVLAAAPGALGAPTSRGASPAGAVPPGSATPVPGAGGAPGTAGPSAPVGGPQPQPAQPPAPEQPGQPEAPEQPEGPGGPGDGGGDEPGEGLVSKVVDPVVVTTVATVDRATGGVLAPVTSPLVTTLDGATDVADRLLPISGGRR